MSVGGSVGTVRYSSPLSYPGHVQIGIMPNPDREVWKSREASFVNDAVKMYNYNYPRKIPIIPKYDPLYDEECAKYFTSPLVQDVIGVTLYGKPKKEKDPSKNINKLSVRRRCPPSPPPEKVDDLEGEYVNDAIITEKMRTKYNDTLLPPYEPLADKHCRDYFDRADVRRVLAKTMSPPREHPLNMYELQSWAPRDWETWFPFPVWQEIRGKLPPYYAEKKQPASQGSKRMTSLRKEQQTSQSAGASRSTSPQRAGSKQTLNGHGGGRQEGRGDLTNRSTRSRKTESETRSSLPEQPLAENPRISINKLSYRRIAMPTASPEKTRAREKCYINDAIPTEMSRTKYRDIIPKYNAKDDAHARAYFKRPDIKRLMDVTCTLKPWEKDVKEDQQT